MFTSSEFYFQIAVIFNETQINTRHTSEPHISPPYSPSRSSDLNCFHENLFEPKRLMEYFIVVGIFWTVLG